jgi:endonuclease/exonuclease/phosphatase (EEP) superfamily protein YafD
VPLGALLWLAAAALALARLGMLAAPLHWTLELSTHFAFQYALASLALLLAFGLRRRRVGLVAGLLLVGVHGAPFVEVARAQLGGGAEATTRREGDLRLLLANVRTSNPQRRPLIELVRASEPDAVLLLEVSQGWLDDLAPLESAYPHRLTVPRGDNFGIAILSARPLVDVRVLDLGASGVPSLEAGFQGSSLRLLLTHPVPPMGAGSAARRDGQLERAAEWAARGAEATGGRVVLAGDLNATPWSPIFRRVLDLGRLRDSREGFGLHRTWPSGVHALLRIPIDHVLVGEEVTVTRREVGPHIGSDHRPVIVDLR